MASIKALDLKIGDLSELEDFSKPNTFRDKLISWLGGVGNGIGKIFAGEVKTDKICVKKSDGEYTCVNGDELDALLLDAGVGGGGGTPPETPEPEEPAEEEVVEEEPEPVEPPAEAPAEESVTEETPEPATPPAEEPAEEEVVEEEPEPATPPAEAPAGAQE